MNRDPIAPDDEALEGQAPSGRTMLIGNSVVAVLAVAFVAIMTVVRWTATFTTGGLVLDVAVAVSSTVPTAAAGTVAQANRALVTIAAPGAGLVVLSVATIAVAAVASIGATGCALALTREIASGRAFGRRAIGLLNSIASVVFLGFLVCYQLDYWIGRLARQAGGLPDPIGSPIPVGYWTALAASLLLTTIAMAFRHGARLQRDTEGLV